MNIVILDTNCSNLYSIKLAIIKLGYNPIVSCDPDVILNAKKLFVPGVGSSLKVMNELYKKNLFSIFKKITCPILGICLGMQVLSIFSEESFGTNMTGIINVPVLLLRVCQSPLPHTGWNQVFFKINHPLFHGINSGSWFYFIHSYGMPVHKYTITRSYYEVYFTSCVQKKNFFGVQFHPEKSGILGSKLLLNFLEM